MEDTEQIILKDKSVTSDPRLTRLIDYDPRSLNYPVRQLVRGLEPQTRSWMGYTTDQGAQGACVGHSVVQEAACAPVHHFGHPVTNPVAIHTLNEIARQVYFRAQQLDPWPGGEYPGASPNYAGTSILAGMKAGMERGWWQQYRWALGEVPYAVAQDVILSLSHLGPVVVGSYWWTGMWRADSRGFLRVAGKREGGHAYLLTKYDKMRDAVWTPNSWGGEGSGWISREDLAFLLWDDGEAAIPFQHPVKEPEPIKPEPQPEPTPDPEPTAEPKPEPVTVKYFTGSNTFHSLAHYRKKAGKQITKAEAIDKGMVPCRNCKP